MQYYYSEYGARNGYITVCIGYMMPGDTKEFICYNVTQQELDKYDTYQTFDFIMENVKETFLIDMVVLFSFLEFLVRFLHFLLVFLLIKHG